jgi:hypothetical protein
MTQENGPQSGLWQNQKLDEYTLFVVPIVLAEFPDWESLATVKTQPNGLCTLEFNVPCGNPRIDSGLSVSTAYDELTISFDWDHRHFTDTHRPWRTETVLRGLKFAREYLNDQRGCLDWFAHDKMIMGTSVAVPFALKDTTIPEGATRYRVRSWSGRHDIDGTLPK